VKVLDGIEGSDGKKKKGASRKGLGFRGMENGRKERRKGHA